MRPVFIFGLVAAFRIASAQTYAFTGEVTAAGTNRMPTGKFETLRVTFGVITPGAQCNWWGVLADESGREIEFRNSERSGTLPAGRSQLALDFEGYKVERARVDGSLILKTVSLSCGPVITDNSWHRIGSFHSTDFDDSFGEFSFAVPSEPVRIAAGDAGTGIPLVCKCEPYEEHEIEILLEADEAKIEFFMVGQDGSNCADSASCLRAPWNGSWSFKTAANLTPGSYPLRLTARGLGKVRTATVDLIVDTDLTQRKQQRDAALRRLQTEDAIPPTAPTAPPPALPGAFPPPPVEFKTGVSLRKIHAVLVLDRSNSLGISCEFVRAAATRFVRLFAEGRDSVSVVSYGTTVQRTLPMSEEFLAEGPDRVSKIICGDTTNTGEAFEIAQQELAQSEDPEAINTVILFTDGQSNVLAANWPVKPAGCTGSDVGQDGQVPALLVLNGDRAIFEPTVTTEKNELYWYGLRDPKSCFGASAVASFAYMPEQDLHGVSLSGNHPLDRFVDGPYRGRIRLDSVQNRVNAISNQVENAARQLRAQPNPVFLYVVGFGPPAGDRNFPPLEYLRQLTNDPKSASYNPAEPAGLAIVTDTPEGFFPSFQRVRADIVEHATVR